MRTIKNYTFLLIACIRSYPSIPTLNAEVMCGKPTLITEFITKFKMDVYFTNVWYKLGYESQFLYLTSALRNEPLLFKIIAATLWQFDFTKLVCHKLESKVNCSKNYVPSLYNYKHLSSPFLIIIAFIRYMHQYSVKGMVWVTL